MCLKPYFIAFMISTQNLLTDLSTVKVDILQDYSVFNVLGQLISNPTGLLDAVIKSRYAV